MTQQVINIGTAPNTSTGDPLRTAFQKANANFAELYLLFGPGFVNPFLHALMAPSGQTALLFQTGNYSFGNAADNPDFTFLGSGTAYLPNTVARALSVIDSAGNSLLAVQDPATTLPAGSAVLEVRCPSANPTPAGYIASFSYVGAPVPLGDANGVWISAGTNANDSAFQVENAASSVDPANRQSFFNLHGDGSGELGPSPNQLIWDTAGHFSLTGTATLPPPALALLADVAIGNLQPGQVLTWDATSQKWVNSGPYLQLAADGSLSIPGDFNVGGRTRLFDLAVTTDASIAGYLTLGHDPTQPPQATTKFYVDNLVHGMTIAGLAGVVITDLQNGQTLVYNAATGNWVNASAAGGIPLASLTDVALTDPAAGDLLTYDATIDRWVNLPAPVPPPPFLSALLDVSIVSPAAGQVLAWDAVDNKWENAGLPGGEVIALGSLMDVVLTSPVAGQTLTYDATNQRWVNGAGGALATLSDVTLTAQTNNQPLVWNDASQRWVNASGVGPGLTWNATGAYAIAAPTVGGAALTVSGTGLGSSVTLQIIGAGTVGQSRGLSVNAGTNASDYCIFLRDTHYTQTYFQIFGDGHGQLGPSTANGLNWDTAGNFTLSGTATLPAQALANLTDVALGTLTTRQPLLYDDVTQQWVNGNYVGPSLSWTDGGAYFIGPPPTATALTVTGAANSWGMAVVGSSLSGLSRGLNIQAGTNSSDYALSVSNYTGGAPFLNISGDGSGFLGPNGTNNLSWNTAGRFYLTGNAVLTNVSIVHKLSSTARNNTSTPSNDPELTFAITSAGTYLIKVLARFSQAVAGGIGTNCNVNFSGTITSSGGHIWASGVSTPNAYGFTTRVQALSSNTAFSMGEWPSYDAPLFVDAVLVAGSAGTFAFAWAQNIANASVTALNPDSWMTVQRIA